MRQILAVRIRGDAGPYLRAAISERLHREIPGSLLIRIPTGGHFIQEDEPERVVQEIKAFFKRDRVCKRELDLHGRQHVAEI